MGSKDDLNSGTDACTHSKQVVGTEMRWPGHNTHWYTGVPRFPSNYAYKAGADTWAVRMDLNACTDACTHSKQDSGNTSRVTGTHTQWQIGGTQVSMKLCIGNATHISRQGDKNSCTDTCTHSKQGAGPQPGWLGHTHTVKYRGTQVSMKLCMGEGSDMHSQVGHKFMYWCIVHILNKV